jgi:hypothetical protein
VTAANEGQAPTPARRIQEGFARGDEFRGVFMVFGGNLVAPDAAMRDRIDRAIRDHDDRIERGGQRLCVTLAGQTLRRTSYKIEGKTPP